MSFKKTLLGAFTQHPRGGEAATLSHQIRSGLEGYNRSGDKKVPICCNGHNRCNLHKYPTARKFLPVNHPRRLNRPNKTNPLRKSREDSHFPGGVPREGSFWLINFFFARPIPDCVKQLEASVLRPLASRPRFQPISAPSEEIYERRV
ncbi:conserved hypothetical protein [Rhodopirellula baltica SH 1]|uniref:Uncharacterized protein n=1 Tax=Rhodopirellula baltica (strain DSM 10527 / NCIMB 13988 / SH1) TaxID=243090 RepID=Q7URA3_RHOBA|nr:conserved hypothetical protein [Rhodopirellula baltica SH 1]